MRPSRWGMRTRTATMLGWSLSSGPVEGIGIMSTCHVRHVVRITREIRIESFPDQKLASGYHRDSWTNKAAKCDNRVSPLSPD